MLIDNTKRSAATTFFVTLVSVMLLYPRLVPRAVEPRALLLGGIILAASTTILFFFVDFFYKEDMRITANFMLLGSLLSMVLAIFILGSIAHAPVLVFVMTGLVYALSAVFGVIAGIFISKKLETAKVKSEA